MAFRSGVSIRPVLCGTVIAAMALCSASVQAGLADPPYFEMTWNASGDGVPAQTYNWEQFGNWPQYGSWEVPGADGSWTGWNYTGKLLGQNEAWQIDWNVVFDTNGADGVATGGSAFVVANIVVTNNSNSTENFQLLMTLPVIRQILNPLKSGSIVGTVTDLNFNDATVSAPTGEAIYTALIDGADEHQLLVDPFSQDAGGPLQSATVGPEDFGVPVPVPASQAVDTDIGILLNFDLTAGDSASFTSIFEVIPAPGVLPALAAFGLLGGRRRRRS